MKKHILVIATLLVGTIASAQSWSDEVQLGARGGLNFSSVAGDDIDSPDNRTSFYAGLVAEAPLSERFSVQPEVFYSGQGFDLDDIDAEFQVESYLRHQGDTFSKNFDPNTYLIMTKLLDYFDPASKHNGDLTKAFEEIKAKILAVSFSSDWRFPPSRSSEIVNALISANKNISYLEIESSKGHDSFLFPEERYTKGIKAFLLADYEY